MAGFDTTKPRRRASHKAQLAAAAQKQNHGGVGTETVLGAARRSSRRAKDLQSMETVQTTLQQADITTQKRLVEWSDRGNTLVVLRDKIDPRYAQQYAVQTCALRTGRDLEQVTAAVAESEAGAAANAASAKAGATAKRVRGFTRTRAVRQINAAGRVTTYKRKETFTGEQVKEKARRDRQNAKLPPHKRKTFKTQTLAPGTGGRKSQATGRARSKSSYSSKRSRAEISAQVQTVTGPYYGRGEYKMRIPKAQWSNRALKGLGFGSKPKRDFHFSGPTAKADADAFDETMMEWLENPNRVKPPPHLRKS